MNIIESQLEFGRTAFVLENCCSEPSHAVHQCMTGCFIDLSAPDCLDVLLSVTDVAELPILQFLLDDLPQILYRVKIRRISRPF